MRTTYVYKHSQQPNPKEERVNTKQEKVFNVSLTDTYLLVKAIAANVNQTMVDNIESKILENVESEPVKEKAPEKKQPIKSTGKKEKKPKKTGLIVSLCVLSVLLLVGVLSVGYFLRDTSSSIEDLQSSVDDLYTSADKVDIREDVTQKDVEALYEEIANLKNKGKDTSSITEELNTISYFIQDKSRLSKLNDPTYDLTTMGLSSEIEEIRGNTKNYTIESLSDTTLAWVITISSQYDAYIDLKLKMQSVADLSTFDESEYASKIEIVQHEPNKEELQAILNILVADKKAFDAQTQLDSAQSEEEITTAQTALQEAQTAQQGAQSKLTEIQEGLKSAINYTGSEPIEN